MIKKKIGGVIVSDLNHTNYGSALQAYATMKVIQNLGYDLTFIKYTKRRSKAETIRDGIKYLICGGWKRIKREFKTKLILKMKPEYARNLQIRKNATNYFKIKEFVPFFKEYIGYKALCAGSKEYDVCFVGSDQTWLPLGFYSNYWNLNFVDDKVPKFSYASSYGVSDIPYIQRTGTKRYLERIDMISVREAKGKQIVESYSNKKAMIVSDPTMLLTSVQWMEFASQSEKKIEEHYIFCYFLGPRRDIREQAIKLAKDTGCKIVINPHMEEYRKADENIGDYIFYDLTPNDFVNLLSHADYVCTDSFHGTVFSILTHRKFMTFYREFGQSTNSRIDNVLNVLELKDRLFNGEINDIKNDINYDSVEKRIKNYREESMIFLKKALALSNKY